MGSADSRQRGDDLEGEAASSAAISEAGAAGASEAVREAISTAQRVAEGGAGGGAGAGGGTGAGGRAAGGLRAYASDAISEEEPPARRVAGVLSLVDAQTAASDGATHGIAALERHLKPSASRFACLGKRFDYDITRAEGAAAAGAAAGVKAVALMVARNVPGAAAGEGFDAEQVLAAARMGARAGSLAVRLHVTPAVHLARYTGLLGPLLGGSLPASAAVYHLLSSSSDSVKLSASGGMAVGVFLVSSGFIVGSLGSSRWSATYCRYATLSAFAILWLFLTFGLCSLFVDPGHWYGCGAGGIALVLALAAVWLYHGW